MTAPGPGASPSRLWFTRKAGRASSLTGLMRKLKLTPCMKMLTITIIAGVLKAIILRALMMITGPYWLVAFQSLQRACRAHLPGKAVLLPLCKWGDLKPAPASHSTPKRPCTKSPSSTARTPMLLGLLQQQARLRGSLPAT